MRRIEFFRNPMSLFFSFKRHFIHSFLTHCGPHKEWDVYAEYLDLELSLYALDICVSGDASATRSTSRVASSAEQASCSIFADEDEEFN